MHRTVDCLAACTVCSLFSSLCCYRQATALPASDYKRHTFRCLRRAARHGVTALAASSLLCSSCASTWHRAKSRRLAVVVQQALCLWFTLAYMLLK